MDIYVARKIYEEEADMESCGSFDWERRMETEAGKELNYKETSLEGLPLDNELSNLGRVIAYIWVCV